jgi:hypothetical protein
VRIAVDEIVNSAIAPDQPDIGKSIKMGGPVFFEMRVDGIFLSASSFTNQAASWAAVFLPAKGFSNMATAVTGNGQ